MKSLHLIYGLVLLTLTANAQEFKFNDKWIAEYTISAPGKSADVLYDDVLSWVSQYYVATKYLDNKPEEKQFTLEIHHFDSFGRYLYPARRPLIAQHYDITYKVIDNQVKITFQHVKFSIDEIDYYLPFSDLINDKQNPLIFKDDKKGMYKSLAGVGESLQYFIETREIRW